MSSTTGQPRNRRYIPQHLEEETALARKKKIEHRNINKHSSSGTATITRHHYDYHHPHSKEHNYCVELVRVCRLAVVAAAAASCSSYSGNENPPPPNEARAIRREGRRAVSAQRAGRVVRTCVSIGRVGGAFL